MGGQSAPVTVAGGETTPNYSKLSQQLQETDALCTINFYGLTWSETHYNTNRGRTVQDSDA